MLHTRSLLLAQSCRQAQLEQRPTAPVSAMARANSKAATKRRQGMQVMRDKLKNARREARDARLELKQRLKEVKGEATRKKEVKGEAKAIAKQAAASLRGGGKKKKGEEADCFDSVAAEPSPLKTYPLVKVAIDHSEENTEASEKLCDPQSYGVQLAEEMIMRLSYDEMHALWIALRRQCGRMPIGTVCSGTDCPVLGLHAISQAAGKILDPMFGNSNFEIDHRFSSEVDNAKREFIEKIVNPPQSFKDVVDLAQSKARNWKVATSEADMGSVVEVATVQWLVGGFPCKDVSPLNPCKVQHMRNVFKLEGKTGGTFGKILRACKRQQDEHPGSLWMILLENVKGLASPPKGKDGTPLSIEDSNLSATLLMLKVHLQHIGYAFALDPRLYGHPQSRPRLYMPSFHADFLKTLKCDPLRMYQMLKEFISRFSNGYGRVPIRKLLLPANHPTIAKYLAEEASSGTLEEAPTSASAAAAASACVASSSSGPALEPQVAGPSPPIVVAPLKGGKGKANRKAAAKLKVRLPGERSQKWPSKHVDNALELGIDWNTIRISVTPALLERYPGFRAVTDREIDVLGLKGVKVDESSVRVLDISQSAGRGGAPKPRKIQHTLACCTPRERSWITGPEFNRFLHGAECFNFQGINYSLIGKDHLAEIAKYPNHLLQDLAGNAFHLGCSIAISLAMLCAVGKAIVARDQLEVPGDETACEEEASMSVDDAAAALDVAWAL